MPQICTAIRRYFKNIYRKLFFTKCKVLVVGLPKTGKSFLISKIFEQKEPNRTSTRITSNKYELDKYTFIIHEIPGGQEYRIKWDHYYKKCNLLIYCVDSVMSSENLKMARDELQNLLYRNTWVERPLLVLGTKNDLENGMSCKDIILKLDLTSLQNRDVSCYSVSVKDETNLNLVWVWITEQIEYMNNK